MNLHFAFIKKNNIKEDCITILYFKEQINKQTGLKPLIKINAQNNLCCTILCHVTETLLLCVYCRYNNNVVIIIIIVVINSR